MKDYSKISPLDKPIPAARQSAKRHYGVHPYFTRRPPNVVRKYITHYSEEGDRVLDPFGGSGVTAIEAFLENRVGIHNDINPLANFIAKGIVDLSKGNLSSYKEALSFLRECCEDPLTEIDGANETRLQEIRTSLSLPANVDLPRNSDVQHYYDLFTLRQLCSLALLKDAVGKIKNLDAQKGMLLAWSATLSKLNKTFLSAEGRAESRGGSSIFSIYRYKIANEPVELPSWKTFRERAINILAAKEEIDKAIELKSRTSVWSGVFEEYECDIDELSGKLANSIDYIFTDPPYGGHISYLDLSVLWNVWLGLSPSIKVREKELIVGGELALSEQLYIERLGKSIRSCSQLLKKDRWLSVVFQHWNPEYFEAILSSAAQEGVELRSAISQIGDPVWSMHKKKNKESVLAGELILSFYKSGRVFKPRSKNGFNVEGWLETILVGTRSEKIYTEQLFNDLIIEAWNNSAIESLKISRDDFTNLIESYGWNYDSGHHCWTKQKAAEVSLFHSP